jgi:hypothetical protein
LDRLKEIKNKFLRRLIPALLACLLLAGYVGYFRSSLLLCNQSSNISVSGKSALKGFSFSEAEASPFSAIVQDGSVSLPGVSARSNSPWSNSGINFRLGKTIQYSSIRENSLKRFFAHSVKSKNESLIHIFSYSNNLFVYRLREIII